MCELFQRKQHIVYGLVLAIVSCLSLFQLHAQDLEPRLLSPVPTGGNFAIASYGYSAGNILLDNTMPVEDLNSR